MPKPSEAVAILKELYFLKKHKEMIGKDDTYRERQPKAWAATKEFLSKFPGGIELYPAYFVHDGRVYKCIGSDDWKFWTDDKLTEGGQATGFDQGDCDPLYY